MAKVKTYYEILGVDDKADTPIIIQALAHLRLQNNNDSYQSLLNNIESVLTNRQKRNEYDHFLSTQQLIDNDTSTPLTTSNFPAQQTSMQDDSTKRPAQMVNAEQSSSTTHNSNFVDLGVDEFLSKEEREFKKKRESDVLTVVEMKSTPLDTLVFNQRLHQKIINFVILLVILAALAWAGNKLYIRWQVTQQSDQATETLWQASKDIEQFIRTHHYFPEQLVSSAVKSPYYVMRLQDKDIILTFTPQAAGSLPYTQLIMKSRHVKKIGLTWQCLPGATFPQQFLPHRCY